jgi:predicted transposase YbfD/YdcC
LHAFPIEPEAAGFAGARSLIVVRSEVYTKKTAITTKETRFYLSSQAPQERSPAQWQALVRGHWAGVESRNHWRRDHLWGEDGSRTNKAHALANLALLRNALLTLLPEHYPTLSLKQVMEHLHSNPAQCLRVIR